jgi:L-threonylcarbamoyladenylate synthase
MQILKLNRKNFKEIVKIVTQSIKGGKVIICPTDTVYIPAADATNKKAVKKVFLIKKRSVKKPIPVFIKDIKAARRLAYINKKQEQFLKKVWPGRVTAVLKRKKSKIKLYGVDKKTIALRIPNFKLIGLLLKKLDIPLVGTSANISNQLPSGNLRAVLQQFKNKKYQPDLVIDGGILPGKPSTVFDLIELPPKILRP